VETARKERVKIRVPREAGLVRFLMSPIGKTILGFFFVIFTIAGFTFTYFYVQYAKVIDQKLKGGPFTATSKIFAAPEIVAIGDPGTPTEVAAYLRRAGYSESRNNSVGSYNFHPDSVEIFPGPDSYFNQEPGVIRFAKDHIVRIISLTDNTDRGQFALEPELLTNVYDKSREKQRKLRRHLPGKNPIGEAKGRIVALARAQRGIARNERDVEGAFREDAAKTVGQAQSDEIGVG